MLKRKIDNYLKNHFETSRNALLVTGARQVGKTYSIREFGKTFKNFIEINFVELPPSALRLFKEARNAKDILLRLSSIVSLPADKSDTLIFFDEVQLCPEIVTAIKFLVDEGSYRYILSGSLLGVELNDLRSAPVGYMDTVEMFPLDFEEFLSCQGVNELVLDSVADAWKERKPVDELVHESLVSAFRLYLVVGGMPAAVNAFLETNNLKQVLSVQQQILLMYKHDISKYDQGNKLKIKEIFDLIPPELNARNKRFILKNLNEKTKFDRMENSFIWLKDAGAAIPVYNVDEPTVPLLLSRSRNLFKLFQNDVGLLAAQYADDIQSRIISGDSDINCGSIYENAVAQELTAHGLVPYYYNSKKRGELDFVVELSGKVLPIEVKSGKDYQSHRALSNVMNCQEYGILEALVLSNANIEVKGNIVYAPVYMVMFLKKNNSAPAYYRPDLSALMGQDRS